MTARRSRADIQECERMMLELVAEFEGVSLSDIAEECGFSRTQAARLVTRMTRRKLLTRSNDRAFGSRSGELQIVHGQSSPNFS